MTGQGLPEGHGVSLSQLCTAKDKVAFTNQGTTKALRQYLHT